MHQMLTGRLALLPATARLSHVAKASQSGHYAMLRLHFERGARPELANAPQPDYDGRRPLYLALDQNWINPVHACRVYVRHPGCWGAPDGTSYTRWLSPDHIACAFLRRSRPSLSSMCLPLAPCTLLLFCTLICTTR